MAQFASEPLLTLALEVVTASVPPTLASTPSVPLVTPGFHLMVSGALQLATGRWLTHAHLDTVTKPILMTPPHAVEAPLTPLS